MITKVLVPWDGSLEPSRISNYVQDYLDDYAQVILLHVVPSVRQRILSGHVDPTQQLVESERISMKKRLESATPAGWNCEVIVGESVPGAIAEFAEANAVDLVSMYTKCDGHAPGTHDCCVAEEVKRLVSRDVHVRKLDE